MIAPALGTAVVTALVAGVARRRDRAVRSQGRPGGGVSAAAAASPVRADGFASVDAPGQDGTYGGRGGATVTARTLADLERYVTDVTSACPRS